MANTEKKYASLETLTSYDGLIKTYITTEIDEAVSTKSNSDHTHIISDVTNLQTELDAINGSVAQKSQVQIITPESTEVLPTLHIHKLTQEEYDEKVASGEIDETALYLTPDEEIDLSEYATVEQLEGKADTEHTHNDVYYTETEIDEKIAAINESISNLDSTTTIDDKISAHDTSNSAHNDIRSLIDELSTKLNTFLDVDDTTTDQLSEVLALIEQNKDVLESFTNKVNVSDIVDNLTTADASKVLSANQGVVIKALIDELQAVVDGKADAIHSHSISDITNLQSTLDEKQTTINGAASTITSSNLDSGKVLISNDDGKVDISTITSVELDYLSGVTSSIQTQFSSLGAEMSGKANVTHTHTTADVTDLQSELDNINSEIDGCITDLSVSGQTITYTRNDGSTGTITTQDENTDTNVTNTLATTTKAYITGTTSNTTNTGTQVFDTGVYLDDVAGQLVATTFKGDLIGNADSATKAVQDDNNNIITTTYETKADAITKLEEAKSYTDSVKNELLNGAGSAYDTLKELGDLIDDNTDAIDALEIVASGKADAAHSHNDLYYTKSEINNEISTINSSISASTNEAKQYAAAGDTTTLEASKTYTDNAVAQKSQVQIITWGADD